MQPSWEAWLVKGILQGKYQNQWPIHRCRFAAFRGLMRNNYNLFAHHSAQAEKNYLSARRPLHLFAQWRMWPSSDERWRWWWWWWWKLENDTCLICFLRIFFFFFAKRNSCGRVGKISKSASLTPMRHFGISMSMSCWVLMVIDVTFEPASEPVPKPHHLEPDLGWVYQIGSLLAAHSRPTHPPSSQKP